MMDVAVVILNYNGKIFLEKFLPVVVTNSAGARVIVADNASTDDSVSWIRNHCPTVELISIPSNLGFCAGYNFALKQVKATYYVLLNSDVEVTPEWIDPIIELMESNPAIAAAHPKILSYAIKNKFEYAGAAGGFVDSFAYPFCRGRIFDSVETDQGQYNDTREVFWATGACLFIRSSRFHEHHGFDEDFFAHMEEIDLCWKLKRQGHQIFYDGRSQVYHVGGGTLAASDPRKTYLNFRNGLYLMVKHLPPGQLYYKLPLRVLLDWLAGFRMIFTNPMATFAVGRAHFVFFMNLIRTLRKRKDLKRIGNFEVSERYPRLLIPEFFIRGKRIFRDLDNF